MAVVFSDLHLREQSADICFRVLDYVGELASHQTDLRVIFCGDFWHLRYAVDVRLLNRVHEVLTHWVEKIGLLVDFVPGNHDQVNVEGRNALEVFERDGVRVWSEPGFDEDMRWGFVPYRKDPEEQLAILQAVVELEPVITFGHFAVQGAVMNSGRTNREEGLTADQLGSGLVLGHYHRPQQGPGWRYVGSPYQTNFGETGDACGCLIVNGSEMTYHDIDVGAPRHHVLVWDPAAADEPPALPQHWREGDKVRVDIKASQEMIVSGKFKTALKSKGLDEAQVNIMPVAVNRDVKISLSEGETLLEAAERFVRDRLGATDQVVSAGFGDRTNPMGSVMESLRRWANG